MVLTPPESRGRARRLTHHRSPGWSPELSGCRFRRERASPTGQVSRRGCPDTVRAHGPTKAPIRDNVRHYAGSGCGGEFILPSLTLRNRMKLMGGDAGTVGLAVQRPIGHPLVLMAYPAVVGDAPVQWSSSLPRRRPLQVPPLWWWKEDEIRPLQ